MKASGVLLVAVAAVCWGLTGGIGALLIDRGWDPFVITFYRGGIGLLVVAGWLMVKPGGHGLGSGLFWVGSIAAGLGIAGNFTFYFLSIREGSVAVAATLMYCAPVYVFLTSALLGFEKINRGKILVLSIVLAGVLLLTTSGGGSTGTITVTGVVTGLLSGVSYAVFIFGFKYATPRGSPQAILAVAFIVLSIALFPLAGSTGIVAAAQGSDWTLFVAVGVLGAGFSFVCYIFGLRTTVPSAAALVAMIEPLTAILFGYIALGQTLTSLQVIGGACILAGVAALARK